MCGINGFLSFEQFDRDAYMSKVELMNKLVFHRGPDSTGIYAKENIIFGFQRLSIIDLSASANQPMLSADGSIVIVFNGEIYNYIEIQNELIKKGYIFTTHSDTEVILNAYKEWGADCVSRFNGMWAFAIYDFNTKTLFASRDRLGVKPFYYRLTNDSFIFSSETKAISKVCEIRKANKSKAFEYIAYGYVKGKDGETFYDGINELLPANNIIICNNKFVMQPYWELKPNRLSFKNAEERSEYFTKLFEDALKIRFRSDVPVGLLLSGGLDSSVIAKVADKLILNNSIKQANLTAYTAQFTGFKDNEYEIASAFSKTLSHIRLKPVSFHINEMVDNIENIIYGLDQPVGGFNVIIHYYLMKQIKNDGITVVLNGQGADEAFYGYTAYIIGHFLWDTLLEGRGDFFKQFSAIQHKAGYSKKAIFNQLFKAMLPVRFSSYLRAKYQENTIENLSKDFIKSAYHHLKDDYKFSLKGNNLINYSIKRYIYANFLYILFYEDMSSMLNSIEMRSPFIDYRIMEFAFSIPDTCKYDFGVSKKIIRQTIGAGLPDNIVNSYKKIGFSVPFNDYLKTKIFADYYKDIISSKSCKDKSIWNADSILDKMQNMDANERFPFWRILNYELWCKTNQISGV